MSQGTIIDRSGPRGQAWLLKYDAGKDANGKRKVSYATVRGTKKEARAKLRELLSHVDKGTHVDRSKMTVAEWIDERMASAEGQKKTLERYHELAKYITSHPISKTQLQQVSAAQIIQFYKFLRREGGRNGAPLSPTTVRHVHRIFSSAMGAARRFDLRATNPFDKFEKEDMPKAAKSKAVSFAVTELSALLTSLLRDDDGLLPIVRLAVKTGMRRGELLALRWAAVDFDKRLIHVRESLEETRAAGGGGSALDFKAPKSAGSARTISVSEVVIAELRAYRAGYAEAALQCGKALTANWLVFPVAFYSPEEPRKPRSVSEAFTDRLTKYGLKKPGLSFHSLRHTHASILIRNGVNIKQVSKRLGHAKPSITLDIYTHEMDDDQSQAVQAVDAFFSETAATV